MSSQARLFSAYGSPPTPPPDEDEAEVVGADAVVDAARVVGGGAGAGAVVTTVRTTVRLCPVTVRSRVVTRTGCGFALGSLPRVRAYASPAPRSARASAASSGMSHDRRSRSYGGGTDPPRVAMTGIDLVAPAASSIDARSAATNSAALR